MTEDLHPSVVVVGSLNMDVVVQVPRHPQPGETILGGDYFKNPGGKGANQAVAASRLQQRVAMLGRVGRDEDGRVLLSALQDEGVDTGWVTMNGEAATGMATITVDPDGENAIVVSPGANGGLHPPEVAKASELLRAATVLLLQLEVPVESVIAAAQSANGTVILNPAPAQPLPQDLLDAVDILVPNRLELATLVRADIPSTLQDAAALARRIEGVDAVVVTLGAEGALLVDDHGETIHAPAPRVEVIDTTAAGDAFCGALADAVVRGERLADAVRWAVSAASLTTMRPGAQAALPSREEVYGLLDRIPLATLPLPHRHGP